MYLSEELRLLQEADASSGSAAAFQFHGLAALQWSVCEVRESAAVILYEELTSDATTSLDFLSFCDVYGPGGTYRFP